MRARHLRTSHLVLLKMSAIHEMRRHTSYLKEIVAA